MLSLQAAGRGEGVCDEAHHGSPKRTAKLLPRRCWYHVPAAELPLEGVPKVAMSRRLVGSVGLNEGNVHRVLPGSGLYPNLSGKRSRIRVAPHSFQYRPAYPHGHEACGLILDDMSVVRDLSQVVLRDGPRIVGRRDVFLRCSIVSLHHGATGPGTTHESGADENRRSWFHLLSSLVALHGLHGGQSLVTNISEAGAIGLIMRLPSTRRTSRPLLPAGRSMPCLAPRAEGSSASSRSRPLLPEITLHPWERGGVGARIM
jgi:hypothetical protein